MRTHHYPSDVTDAQWDVIEPHLPPEPGGGRPRTTRMRDVLDAVLYILRTGCQWRYLPGDLPPKSTAWRHFDRWRRDGVPRRPGAWLTTTANLWGGLALEKFSKRFESAPVTGITAASLGAIKAQVDWSKVERIKAGDTSGAPNQASAFGAPASPGSLRNNTMFIPWPGPNTKARMMPSASATVVITSK